MLRQCGTHAAVVVVDIVVVNVAPTRIGVKLVVVVWVRRTKPEPFNHIPVCYGLAPDIPVASAGQNASGRC